MDGNPKMQADVTSRLHTLFMAKHLHFHEVASSTQDIARELAENGAPEGTAVLAGRQESGRGRSGRSWLSPSGGLATSVVLRPDISELYLLPAVSSLATRQAIEMLGLQADIKWPNDLLICGRKVCGILIEHSLSFGTLKYSILGIGINVNFNTSAYHEISDIATSLSMHLGEDIPLQKMAVLLYTELENFYLRIKEPKFLLDKWAEHMITLGQRVTSDFYGKRVDGIARRVSSNGSLVIELPGGTEQEIVAGDILSNQDGV